MKKIIVILLLIQTLNLFAQSNEKLGFEIAQKAVLMDQGFKSLSTKLKMTLKNRNGQTSERLLENKILEQVEDGDFSLIIFNTPKDVKGTATLTYTHKIGPDDQWLFLPAVNRVKRISSSNKSGPFMGSEFSFEDLASAELEKYSYKFISEKDDFKIVEAYPVDEKSGYSKRIVYYNSKKNYRVEKVEFYDRKGDHLKTLRYEKFNLYKEKFWRADVFTMKNHQTNKETVLEFSDWNFDANFSRDDFTQEALKKAGN
ncbi:MAG: outer membrane lipoprotein-sorting protein [Flavobacteriales bacterium TMED288]|nr:outer membrane lipoprotein-sorting protein [Flavobacteriales bacterium]RPG53072.1 MAG: outer membrane lipoprotein-sorting protein [Flavobacteriales bacterium TMED288]|tara:strand:- start:4766 stop:5536 length:771 start_codon:yes stop_codon:yes gene_type:complete